MNTVALIGRLTRDPSQRMANTTNGEMEIARFTLAVDRRQKSDSQSADFISCVAFGKTAEVINKNLTQGRKIGVNGRIQTGSYTNKDGATVYTTDVIVEQMTFCDSKQSGGSSNNDEWANIPDDVGDEGLPFN